MHNAEVWIPFLQKIELQLRDIYPRPPALHKIRHLLFLFGIIAEDPTTVDDYIAEGSGARLLLVEIIRRTAYDWVLYRNSTRIEQKHLAQEAYVWLFEEDINHPQWRIRRDEGRELTAFVSICEVLDIEIEKIRAVIKKLTPDRVLASGRFSVSSAPTREDKEVEVHTKLSSFSMLDFEGFEV